MTRIADLLAEGRTCSFEFFPPKTDEAARSLEKTVAELEVLHPSFVSVTYGAGGSTRERTRDIVIHIERDTGITAMAHLTCVGHASTQLTGLLDEYRDAGISNLLALAGDPPADAPDAFDTGDFIHAVELVELIREHGGFSMGVAAHPEGHPRSSDITDDRRHLAAKLEVADFAITQFFFEPEPYLSMVDDLAALGCTKPVIPGIMPVTNAGQVARFAQLAGAEFPPHLAARFDAVADDPEAVRQPGRAAGHRAVRTAPRRGRARPALLHVEPLHRDPRDRRQPRTRPPGLRHGRRTLTRVHGKYCCWIATTQPSTICTHTPAADDWHRRIQPVAGRHQDLPVVDLGRHEPDGHVGHDPERVEVRALVAEPVVVRNGDLRGVVLRGRHVGGVEEEEAGQVEVDGPAVGVDGRGRARTSRRPGGCWPTAEHTRCPRPRSWRCRSEAR